MDSPFTLSIDWLAFTVPASNPDETMRMLGGEWNKAKAAAALSTDPIVNDFRHSRAMVDEIFTLAEHSLQQLNINPAKQ